LEEHFMELENHQAEREGLPPPHHIEEKPNPALDWYFEELEYQMEERDALLRERAREGEQHG
jgi:hypothetical protein